MSTLQETYALVYQIYAKAMEEEGMSISKTIKVVDELPTGTDIDKDKIYLVRNEQVTGDNLYDEYIYSNEKWEKLGSFNSGADLSDYYTKDEVDAKGYLTAYTENDPIWTSEKTNYYTKNEVDGKGYLTAYTENDPVWTSEKTNYYTKGEVDAKVPYLIWTGTQAEYDAITTKSDTTIYLIKE